MKPQQFWNSYIYCHQEIFLFWGSLNINFPGEYTPCLALEFTRDGYLLMEESLPSCTSRRTRELLIFASFLLPSLWPHRGIVGCRWHFYEEGIRGCFPVLWEPLNVGCLGCCSLLILAMSGCVLETVRHADRWLFRMLSGISSDNCTSSQLLATELILSTLHNTKVKRHTGNYNYAVSFWDVIHCPLQ